MTDQAVLSHCVRADSYKLLAECYYCPDEGLLNTLANCRKAIGGAVAEVVRNAPKADDLERHGVDYAKLFVGPFKVLASPYGSVYLEDGKLMGDSTLEVKELFKQEGLDIAVKDAPDHISIELEFMYFLVLKEAGARQNANLALAASFRDKQVAFLGTHLGDWVSQFADNIEKNAQTEFYRALGRATRDFVLEDLGKLLAECQL